MMPDTQAPPVSSIDPAIKQPEALGEVKAKIDFWHERMTSKLYAFNDMADMWRLMHPNAPADLAGFANPQLTETTRATEALATFMYRALTSQNPNYELTSYNPNTSQEMLYQSERLIEVQKTQTQYNRKLLRGLRSTSLFGTLPVERPWIRCLPNLEATDFVPRSLLQVAFDPLCFDITMSPWHATLDYVTEEQLLRAAREMPEVFDQGAIQSVLNGAGQASKMTPEILSRLIAAGYLSAGADGGKTSKIYYVVTYYGPLKDSPNPEGKDWCLGFINDTVCFRGHTTSYGTRPYDFSYLNEFEMESYGYGVGSVGKSMQPEMNSNRGRMHDTSTFALFNMWIADRMSGIKGSQLRIKPWGVIEVEGGTKGLEPIRPQLEGINFGLMLEKMMKEEFRSTTGASDALQAMVTEASATESSIAQNEAVRRVSVMAEMQAEPLIRRHIKAMHENNLNFLDQPFWISATGQAKPIRMYPSNLAQDIEVIVKVTTDKDFRPQRNKDIIQLLQILTSIRSDHPEIGSFNLRPWIEELARGVAIDPKLIVNAPGIPGMGGPGPMLPPGAPMPNAMDRVGEALGQAASVRSQAGSLGAGAREMAGVR
jgi:hypothetical protein